jgi:hypothetical protein
MKIDSKNILRRIAAQRDCILQFVSAHGREAIFSDRLNRLCPDGREKVVVELSLVSDCLTAIEAVVFSLNGSPRSETRELLQFLQTAAKLFSRRDKKLYSEFVDLDQASCERFLEVHYTDRGLFGGANRRTQWSGFHLSKKLGILIGIESPLQSYKGIFESVVCPLLDEHEQVDDVLELGGVWSALTEATESSSSPQTTEKVTGSLEGHESLNSIEMADMNNPAILFDVLAGNSRPVVKLNSQHNAFQNGHSFELLIQAWAQMEADAWDERKQMLEDIRIDWGRVARDLSQNEGDLTQ